MRWRREQANSFHNKRECYYSLWYQASKLTGWLFLLWAILFIWESSEDRRKKEQSMIWSKLVMLHVNACCSAPCLILCIVPCDVERAVLTCSLCCVVSRRNQPCHRRATSTTAATMCEQRSAVGVMACAVCTEAETWKTRNARDKKSFKSLCTYFSVGRYSTKCCY